MILKKTFAVFSICLTILCFNAMASADTDSDIEADLDSFIKEVEKKPYSINASLEIKETMKYLDPDMPLFRQKYPGRKKRKIFLQTDLDFTIKGWYEWEMFRLYGRFNALAFYNEDVALDHETTAEEAYITFQPMISLSFDAGKKVHKWGKGYAFNPCAFFSRAKDVNDPDAELEGYWSFDLDYIKSMDSIIRTISITPVVMPVSRNINHEPGSEDEMIYGGKIYFFTFDTDFDFMFISSDNMNDKIGVDFSRNLTPGFEIHGEAAWIKDFHRYPANTPAIINKKKNVFDLLFGIRYLSKANTTYILEYYRNGGWPMKNYLYLKISEKEPFDILYLTPEISFLYNIDGRGVTITPGITYSPVTNLVLKLKLSFISEKNSAQFNKRVNRYNIALSMKYYF